MKSNKFVKTGLATLAAAVVVTGAMAAHTWNDYHWARDTASFDLTIINSTTTDWDGYVARATSDWSASGVLNMVEVDGDTSSRVRRKCNAPSGQVRICNLAYGQNGWLGIAGLSLDSNGHIAKGYTKLNDTYFASGTYNDPDWKQMVACQELGHNVGLGHTSEDFNDEPDFTCMDYQNIPYPYPNAHDYEQLDAQYGHSNDGYNSYVTGGGDTGGGGGGGNCNPNSPKCNGQNIGFDLDTDREIEIGWGMSITKHNKSEVFLRIDPDGTRHITHVLWVEGYGDHDDDH